MIKKCKIWMLKKREEINRKKVNKYAKKLGMSENKLNEFLKKETEESSEEWKIRNSQKRAIKNRAIMYIMVCVILLLFSVIISLYIETKKLDSFNKLIIEKVLDVVNIIISIIAGLGVSTFVLDFFSYVQYARERLKEIVVEQSFIQKLSDEEKEKLLVKIEKSLYFKNVEAESNSLYVDVKRKITPLLRHIYFSDFFMRIDCEINEEAGCINKSIFKQMYIISDEDKKKFKIPYYVKLPRVEEAGINEIYVVEKCIYNGEDITKEFWNEELENKKEDEKKKSLSIRSDYEFLLHKGRNKIVLKTRTKVPLSDTTYSHVITLPCMKYTVEYNINTPGYHVLGYGFSFIALDEKAEDKTVNCFRHTNSLRLEINQWTLPGEGSVFIINDGNPLYE